jgi:uncharacterized membrane protein
LIDGAIWWLEIVMLPFRLLRDHQARRRRREAFRRTARREILDARLRIGEIDEATFEAERARLGQQPSES